MLYPHIYAKYWGLVNGKWNCSLLYYICEKLSRFFSVQFVTQRAMAQQLYMYDGEQQMMKHILSRKLNNQTGASLMVALLFFVMCATVGSIILAAATASSGRLVNIRGDDQAYYATSSAAGLIIKQIEGYSVKVTEPSQITGYSEHKERKTYNGKTSGFDNLVDYLVANPTQTITATISAGGKSELTVNAEFSMTSDCSIIVKLNSAERPGVNALTLTFPSSVYKGFDIVNLDNKKRGDADDSSVTDKVVFEEYSWKSVRVEEGVAS